MANIQVMEVAIDSPISSVQQTSYYLGSQVAEQFKVSKKTLVRWENDGYIPVPRRVNHRGAKTRVYSTEDIKKIDAFVKSRQDGALVIVTAEEDGKPVYETRLQTPHVSEVLQESVPPPYSGVMTHPFVMALFDLITSTDKAVLQKFIYDALVEAAKKGKIPAGLLAVVPADAAPKGASASLTAHDAKANSISPTLAQVGSLGVTKTKAVNTGDTLKKKKP